MRRSRSRNDSARIIVASDEDEPMPQGRQSSQRKSSRKQSAGSASQADGGFAALNEEQQDEIVKRIVRYVICRSAKKRPVRRTDLTRVAFHNMDSLRGRARIFRGAFQSAQSTLRSVYGMEIRKISRRTRKQAASQRPASASASQGGGNPFTSAYILVSVLPESCRFDDPNRNAEVGFLTIVACIILLSPGCKIEEPDLYRALERVGVYVKENGGHKQVNDGNVKELLEKDFPDQWYLDREKEGNTFYYTLGSRLRAELSDESLVECVDAVYRLGHDPSATLDSMSKKELFARLAEATIDGEEEGEEEDG